MEVAIPSPSSNPFSTTWRTSTPSARGERPLGMTRARYGGRPPSLPDVVVMAIDRFEHCLGAASMRQEYAADNVGSPSNEATAKNATRKRDNGNIISMPGALREGTEKEDTEMMSGSCLAGQHGSVREMSAWPIF